MGEPLQTARSPHGPSVRRITMAAGVDRSDRDRCGRGPWYQGVLFSASRTLGHCWSASLIIACGSASNRALAFFPKKR